MATIFKYKNNIYQCMSLEKKLKRLKINKDDIEILFNGNLTPQELETKYLEISNSKNKEQLIEYQDIKLYYFLNKQTNESITSIYPKLDCYIKNVNDYERCTKDTLEKIWSKDRTT